ncbi:hypothetical protein pipiens_003908 [Culex pipiens pipiens]|uniref:Uncharacterized protein n=2 Tax=Culex pipiens TaxID=7175 RepID=A0ABD1CQV9_CULPP
MTKEELYRPPSSRSRIDTPTVLFRDAQPLACMGVEQGQIDEADLNAVVEPGGKIQIIFGTRVFRWRAWMEKENQEDSTPLIVISMAQIIILESLDCRAIKRG